MRYGLYNSDVASDVAFELLRVGAIKLNRNDPFTWSSGWKSPIYCDNRISLSHPKLRTKIKDHFVNLIKEEYPDCDAIAGVATAGIPQGALIADGLNLPFLYVRAKPKGHGMENMIEGKLIPGQKIVVVEDLISTGGSSLKAIAALREGGADIMSLLSIFNYGFEAAEQNCLESNVNVIYLSDYEQMLPEALKAGLIHESDIESLNMWRKDPSNWS